MIVTVKHKENDKWHDVDLEFPTVDHAKRHAVKEGYAEYKVWQHGDLQCHLFNAVAKAEPKKAKKQKLTVLANLVSKEELAEEDNE
tara:strand:+ start:634 stop:891 length:258 start_codon:yes stop_codon:yes gene_type:complete